MDDFITVFMAIFSHPFFAVLGLVLLALMTYVFIRESRDDRP